MDNHESTLPTKESMTVEFKSDLKCLSDRDLIEALACLANSEGGELWLGVEDDGTPTGLHAKHKDILGLAGLVAARTSPSLSVSVKKQIFTDIEVAKISVPKSSSVIATTAGMYLHRRIKSDGTPECVAMLPHDTSSRISQFGLADVSAQSVAGSTLADFDPLERERLRQAIRHYNGDRILLDLDDEELDGALGFTTRTATGERVPTLTGLLMIGRESALRDLVPTHEFAFQVLTKEAVSFNEFHRFPLLKALEWLETNFNPYNPEQEVQVGLFRVPIPKVDRRAFREAVANALVHRDYHKLGAVHVRLSDDELTISNPGGLMDGVTIQNLLTTEPRPRNPRLADVMKRIGLVERAGRGVDTIYRGMLKFGRDKPDYGRTDDNSVVLQLSTAAANELFLQLVLEQENKQSQQALPLESLIALSVLWDQKRLNPDELAFYIQRSNAQARKTLEKLIEAGLVQAHGVPRNRTYTLSAGIYRVQGQEVEYTRQAGYSRLQQEQMIIGHIKHHNSIQRRDVMELCHFGPDQAYRFLKRLVDEGKLVKHGTSSDAYYTQPE